MKYIPTPREVKKGNYETKCKYCGTTFLANKSTAVFCSALCRVKYYREQAEKKIKKDAAQLPTEKEKTPEKAEKRLILKLDNKCISKKSIAATKITKKYMGQGLPALIDRFNFLDKESQSFSIDKFTASFWIDEKHIKHFRLYKL